MANFNKISDLAEFVGSLALNKVQATKLNRAAGNAMRRVIRANLRSQRDADGRPFAPRKSVNFVKAKSGKISMNSKMFRNASRSLNQDANDRGVAVGYSTPVLKIHNFGENVSFKRSSGKFVGYKMTKRQFLGWSSDMIKEVRDSIIIQYSKIHGAKR